MRRGDIKWAVLRIEGTNSEDESAQCMRDVGVQAEIVHLKQLTGDDVTKAERRKLSDYDGLWIAGGFSAGDYIRAGAILAARMKSKLAPDIKQFIQAGKPMLGICNGFQIMVELGVLPNLEKGVAMTDLPTSVLHLNDSGHYECRPSLLRHVNRGTCKFTTRIPPNQVRTVITSHAEGKLILPSEKEYRRLLSELTAPTYKFTSNGKVQIESKDDLAKRGVASPDLADAFCLALYARSRARRRVTFGAAA